MLIDCSVQVFYLGLFNKYINRKLYSLSTLLLSLVKTPVIKLLYPPQLITTHEGVLIMDKVKFSDLDKVLVKAKAATSVEDINKYLEYFKLYSDKVTSVGKNVVPEPIQDIQSELSAKILNDNNSNKYTSNDWYKKPSGIIALAVISGFILILINQIFFPPIN